eukprot:Clim_evm36s149 gene=Clim_evmTU36s149
MIDSITPRQVRAANKPLPKKAFLQDFMSPEGKHCGSTSLRNAHYHATGEMLMEHRVLGLGSGVSFSVMYLPEMKNFFFNGRSMGFEEDFAGALNLSYGERLVDDDDKAELEIKQLIHANIPPVICGNCLPLPYKERFFPGHRFIAVGYDDDQQCFHVAEMDRSQLELVPYKAMRESRQMEKNRYGAYGMIDDLDLNAGQETTSALQRSLLRAASRMLNLDDCFALTQHRPPTTEQTPIPEPLEDPSSPNVIAYGVKGIHKLADIYRSRFLKDFKDDIPTAMGFIYYSGRVIDAYGTGGSSFRAMYTLFLYDLHQEYGGGLVPRIWCDLSQKITLAWTQISSAFLRIHRKGKTALKQEELDLIADDIDAVGRMEHSLWAMIHTALCARCAQGRL